MENASDRVEAAATYLRTATFACATALRNSSESDHKDFRNVDEREILSIIIEDFDKRGRLWLPENPVCERIMIPRCSFATWISAFSDLGVDTTQLQSAVQEYLAALDEASLSSLTDPHLAEARVKEAIKVVAFNGDFQSLTSPDALGAFLTVSLYEVGLSSHAPREGFQLLSALTVLFGEARSDEGEQRRGRKAKLRLHWGSPADQERCQILKNVYAAYYAHMCGHEGERRRYNYYLDLNSGDYPFRDFRLLLHRFHKSHDRKLLESIIDADLAGHSRFCGYGNMPFGNLVNFLNLSVTENRPLQDSVYGYGGTIEDGHRRMCESAEEVGSIFGVHSFCDFAHHLAKQGLTDRAIALLDAYPSRWKAASRNKAMGNLQELALLRAFGRVYLLSLAPRCFTWVV